MATPIIAATLIELFFWGVLIVAALAAAVALIGKLGAAGRFAVQGTVTFTWTTAPTTVPAGGSDTFVLTSTRTRGSTTTPDVGRKFTFAVQAGYLTVSPAAGTTDLNGTITVTVEAPDDVPVGTNGTLTATEKDSGTTEPVTFTVQ